MQEELIAISCLVCKLDFKVRLDVADPINILKETGYCPSCQMICKSCENKNFDSKNNLSLCVAC